jgi:hypothetical protein
MNEFHRLEKMEGKFAEHTNINGKREDGVPTKYGKVNSDFNHGLRTV